MITKKAIEAFGSIRTPFYYYDMDLLKETLKVYTSYTKKFGYNAHYAIKANAEPKILQTICKAGLGADCVSGNEWLRKYRSEGFAGLECIKKRGRPPGMGRPKKNSKPLTELERLRKEVQELKTENALLKKVRALVEERNARLREIGHGPSKN